MFDTRRNIVGLDELKNKAKEMAGQHPDQVNQGVDKAREFADEKTGGQHSDQLQQGADKLKHAMGGEQQQEQQPNPEQQNQ
ncbi:MAG TPA: antitoxin [Pseudonocardiaceae bacterium]|nr:antitoxin [Pseudonocardiaceae bacterium]